MFGLWDEGEPCLCTGRTTTSATSIAPSRRAGDEHFDHSGDRCWNHYFTYRHVALLNENHYDNSPRNSPKFTLSTFLCLALSSKAGTEFIDSEPTASIVLKVHRDIARLHCFPCLIFVLERRLACLRQFGFSAACGCGHSASRTACEQQLCTYPYGPRPRPLNSKCAVYFKNMPLEYHTVKFPNDKTGLSQKNAMTAQMAAQGWHIVSEQIEQGHIKGSEQCCGALICLPLIFAAGRTPGFIVVTFGREILPQRVVCQHCGAGLPSHAKFCRSCGKNLKA